MTDEELEQKMYDVGNRIAKMRQFPNMGQAREQLESVYNAIVDEKRDRYIVNIFDANKDTQNETIEIGKIQTDDK